MKNLVGKSMTKKVKFLNEEVTIKKLTVAQVLDIQELSKAATGDDSSMDILAFVVMNAVEGAETLTNDELKQFPLEELSRLSNDILVFSGLGNVTKQ
jgi:hypothetical protein